MIEIKNILFPCDLRESSSRILPYVLSTSEKYDSTIHLLHVIEDISKWGGFYIPHIPLEMYQKEAEQTAKKFLEKICAKQLERCPRVYNKILSGDPVAEILKAVDSNSIDLVIMGTHGFKGIEHKVFGSVAEEVVKESSVPVMVINPYKLE